MVLPVKLHVFKYIGNAVFFQILFDMRPDITAKFYRKILKQRIAKKLNRSWRYSAAFASVIEMQNAAYFYSPFDSLGQMVGVCPAHVDDKAVLEGLRSDLVKVARNQVSFAYLVVREQHVLSRLFVQNIMTGQHRHMRNGIAVRVSPPHYRIRLVRLEPRQRSGIPLLFYPTFALGADVNK